MSGSFKIDNPNNIRGKGMRNLRFNTTISDAELKVTVCDEVTQRAIEALEIDEEGTIHIQTTGHGLVTDTPIYVAHCVGAKEANGPQTVTVLDADWFTLNGVVGTSGYQKNGIWFLSLNTLHNVTMAPLGGGNYLAVASQHVNFVNGDSYWVFLDCFTEDTCIHLEAKLKASYRTLNAIMS